ncbi:MAG: FAD binding domain-containing protein [Alkalispirochaeta sp.]
MLHDFLYHDPGSTSEALSLLKEHGEESAVLSGGTDLLVAIRAGLTKPRHVIDLKGIDELHTLSWSDTEGLSIGACVTVNDLVESPIVQEKFPVLYAAGSELATFQLRNRASVIGNIVTASPCGDMSSPLLVHGGRVVLSSAAGERQMPLGEFITGVKRTLIRPDEIVSRIIVPTDWAGARGGYEKLKRIKGHDLGVVAVAMIKSDAGIRVAISSAAPTPVLLPDFPVTATTADIQKKAQEMISPIDDVRATAEYRVHMVDVYIRRLMELLEDNV